MDAEPTDAAIRPRSVRIRGEPRRVKRRSSSSNSSESSGKAESKEQQLIEEYKAHAVRRRAADLNDADGTGQSHGPQRFTRATLDGVRFERRA